MTDVKPLWPIDETPEEWRKFYLQEWPTAPADMHLDSDRVDMVWHLHADEPSKYIVLDGHNGEALVRVQPLPAGYLWQYKRRCGHANSVIEAKAMVEGLADHYALPAEQRWMTL